MNYRELNETGFKPTLKIFKQCLKIFKHTNTKYPQAVGLCRNPPDARRTWIPTQPTQSMYIPRGKLLALVTIVVAASLVTATGAFSSVQTERTAEVNVAGDKNAYLGLQPHEGDNSNGQFAMQNGESGKLQIKFNGETETSEGGQGVNPESITTFDNVFTIVNQGTQTVEVTAKSSSGDTISLYDSDGGKEDISRSIKPGETIDVGIKIDASDETMGANLSDKITIEAVSPDAANPDTSLSNSDSDSSDNSNSDDSEDRASNTRSGTDLTE